MSPGASAQDWGTMMPVPVNSTVPGGNRVGARQKLNQRLQPAVQLGGIDGAFEQRRARRA